MNTKKEGIYDIFGKLLVLSTNENLKKTMFPFYSARTGGHFSWQLTSLLKEFDIHDFNFQTLFYNS